MKAAPKIKTNNIRIDDPKNKTNNRRLSWAMPHSALKDENAPKKWRWPQKICQIIDVVIDKSIWLYD